MPFRKHCIRVSRNSWHNSRGQEDALTSIVKFSPRSASTKSKAIGQMSKRGEADCRKPKKWPSSAATCESLGLMCAYNRVHQWIAGNGTTRFGAGVVFRDRSGALGLMFYCWTPKCWGTKTSGTFSFFKFKYLVSAIKDNNSGNFKRTL